VLNIDEIAHDAHFAAREMLAAIELPGFSEPMRVAGQPIKFAATPAAITRRGPELGEDTIDVLRQHGATDDDIARWRSAGAIPGG
jgi:crotonobetainyl-CoA:carnitine CoA-transferase CaiB-like acyl-CoA transferase